MKSPKIDIIFPKNNKIEAFVELSKELGWDKLIVLKEVNDLKDLKKFEEYKTSYENIFWGALIKVNKRKLIRKLAAELYYNKNLFNDFVIYLIEDFSLIRYVSNIRFFNAITGFEFDPKEDHTHFRRSGINHIIAKNLKENEVAYLIPITLINKAKNREVILGRIFQNIKLQKKYRFDVIICSFASDLHELKPSISIISFAKYLGIENPEKVVSENIIKQIWKTRRAKSPWIFTKGFEIIKFPYEDYEY